MSLIFIASIMTSCPTPKILNQTQIAWNSEDDLNLRQAKKRCKEIYKNSPCLKLFIKRDVQVYAAICGAANA